MEANVLGDDEECAVCLESLELKKCSRYVFKLIPWYVNLETRPLSRQPVSPASMYSATTVCRISGQMLAATTTMSSPFHVPRAGHPARGMRWKQSNSPPHSNGMHSWMSRGGGRRSTCDDRKILAKRRGKRSSSTTPRRTMQG